MKPLSDLVQEDLARSGLTLDDIGGKILSHFDVQMQLGLPSAPGAAGGYTIPYWHHNGSGFPIHDGDKPFARVRLVGAHSDDTPRYLSRPGTSAHLYEPSQLEQALEKSPVLVITEGEKKAVRACKDGIPAVALAGIQMFTDPRDSTKLMPEIRDLLHKLVEKGRISHVLVLFDSDGHPLGKGQLPSDENIAKTYDEFSSGKGFVKNRDVFNAARKLAELIRSSIHGLPVAFGWCKPEIEKSDGPKGGKIRTVKHRGIDDVLEDGGIDTLREWIDGYLKKAVAGDGEGGYLPLGATGDGRGVWMWSKHQNDLIDVPAAQLSNGSVLAGLVGISWLLKNYPKMSKEGIVDVDTKRASMEIAAQCTGRGKFNVSGRVYGTGTWQRESGDLVINTHDGVYLADGTPIERIDESLARREIYTMSGSYSPPAYQPVSDADYFAVVRRISNALRTWRYASDVGADLVLGWMVMTVFLGAMPSRPSLWLVAPRGSGKSQMARFIKSCLGDYAWHTDMGKESTAAGIRQMLQMSSSPCILDEMEKDNTETGNERSVGAIGAILSLIRSAYTAGSDIKKGTADQSGKSFRIMTSFCCVSIADPALEPADLTRIAKIYLRPLVHEGTLSKPPAPLSKADAATFFWGTIQRWDRYQQTFDAIRENWLEVAGNGESREVDTFGVLLAAALTAIGCPVEQVKGVLCKAVPALMDQIQEVREASSESDLILETLFSLPIEVQRYETDNKGNEHILHDRMTVGRALEAAVDRPGSDEAKTLEDYGMSVKEKSGRLYLAVAMRHAGLSRLFQGTRWRRDGAWSGGLRDVDGVIRNHPTRLSGATVKCTWVPLDRIGMLDSKPVEASASTHRFPAPKQIF
ncbi:DUF3854 domain-containing protein [Acidithiobacillus caldus]|uniref:DUF3854 domain-containing protein n=1 Tax=Acidithiobacillus caldus TaxID=33059 RepID=UPI000A80DEF7|nr:DUF3854 domain-containing protein [Acidithiobacillus caldus]